MRLKELRKQHNLSQEQLCKILKLAQTTYSSYEIGKNEPNIETLCKIADYYNVTLDYLVGHKTEIIDTSFYNSTAKNIVKKLPKLNSGNLTKLDAFCDGLIEGQK